MLFLECARVGGCRSGGVVAVVVVVVVGGGGGGGGGGEKRQDRIHPIDAVQDNHGAVLACELLQTRVHSSNTDTHAKTPFSLSSPWSSRPLLSPSYHQGDHRFWLRANATQNRARQYLQMRHSLAPSLIAAGRTVQHQGFPLTARCDLLWPEHSEVARDPTQYIHLNATLVAPLDVEPVDKIQNSRSVWVPPGQWQDAWTGEIVTGPVTMNVSQPPERIPMWHRRGTVRYAHIEAVIHGT